MPKNVPNKMTKIIPDKMSKKETIVLLYKEVAEI